jgi:hypothetical protein
VTEVTISSVVFPAGGVWLAGRLYGAGDAFVRRAGVVVTGSWLTVKEQMADRYASELARRGYAALAFDFTGWGESGGEPRQVETPTSKIADITAATVFVSSRSFVAQGGVAYVAVPSWPNTMAEMSWRHWLTFDGLPAADRVTTLVNFVHLDGCFPDTVRDVARRVRGPVEVAWGDGTQTDFYDQPDQVRFAVQAVGRHLTASMAPGEEEPPPETASTCSGPMRVERHVKG